MYGEGWEEERENTFEPIFSHISQSIWMKLFSMLPQPVGLLKLVLHVIHTINIQLHARELYLHDFYLITCLRLACVSMLVSQLFQTWYNSGHN